MLDMQKDEERILGYWKEHDINNKVREKNARGKKFYFLDGPPYVTGELHPGQIWVKALKDAFVRYKRYRGFNVVDRAGYDVHGLPIENKVERELGITSKKEIEQRVGVAEFVKACRSYVESYMGRWERDYERFGVSLDFSDPYLPYVNDYIETAWGMFKSMSDKGYLYKDKKTLIYCPHCETSLAQGSMEVEYADEEDPSIFVAFEIDEKRSKPKLELGGRTYLLIWTTTPWTIPSNVAVAANPKAMYVRVLFDDKAVIVAKDRLDKVVEALGKSAVIDKEFYGSELDGIHYVSPLEGKVAKQKALRRYHRVVFAEGLVSMEEGTGLVHIAPGNGVEDYALGRKNRLPVFCPVRQDATYSGDAGAYEGLRVPGEANEVVLRDLEENGALMARGKITHSYPHCWRCHNKLIFLATDQWFLKVDRIKHRMISANQKVGWHPGDVQGWQRAVIENSPDWCISRQRYWGIPMPVWACEKCGDFEVMGSIDEIKARSGTTEDIADLHRPHIDGIVFKCRKCNGDMRRVSDILDVWFDSGITFRASLSEDKFKSLFPMDLIIEYIEQIRGWFQYLLKCSMMAYGKGPYKDVIVTGILMGSDGKKMSKSLGNYKPLDDLLGLATSDAFRLWCSMHPQILNRTFNESEIRESDKAIGMLRNISNLLDEYEGVLGYKPKSRSAPKGAEPEDMWILSRVERLNETVTQGMDRYEVEKAAIAINNFIIEDFSRLYLKLAKSRMQASSKRNAKKIIDIVEYVLRKTLVLISPIAPFVAESVFLKRNPESESVFLGEWPKPKKSLINKDAEDKVEIAREAITAILNSREKSNVTLRMPLLSATIEAGEDSVVTALQETENMIEEYANVKSLKIMKGEASRREIVPIFPKLGPEFKQDAQMVADELKKQDADAVESEILKDGHYGLHTQERVFEVRAEHFAIAERPVSENATRFKYGVVSIDATQTEELREELLVRELVRRVQEMRKELKLTRLNKVAVHIAADAPLAESIRKNKKQIAETVRADSFTVSDSLPDTEGIHKKDWDLMGTRVSIGIVLR